MIPLRKKAPQGGIHSVMVLIYRRTKNTDPEGLNDFGPFLNLFNKGEIFKKMYELNVATSRDSTEIDKKEPGPGGQRYKKNICLDNSSSTKL
jgi:hypothetical protein